MNRNRLIVIGIMALAIAAFVTVGIARMLRNLAPKQAQTSPVVVAMTDLKIGSRLAPADLTVVEYPANSLPEGVTHSIPELVGRGVILPISRNEPVLQSKLASNGEGAGLPPLIPAGMRAVSVKVNEVIAVAGFVVPGTRVDVLLTGNPNGRGSSGDAMTTTVLENVEVLAAGQKLERDESGKPQAVPVITLLVSLEDAQKLTLAASEGKIQLALRNPLDLEKKNPFAVKNIALYRAQAAPVPEVKAKHGVTTKRPPAPVVPPLYMVERIAGDKRDVTKF